MDLNDELFQRAQISIPGGVNSPVRAFRSVGGSPRFIDRAKGPYMWDATGKQFIDYILSWGPMILGHNNDEVIAAVDEAVSKGLSFGAVTQGETLIAEKVRKLVPSMDQVRLVSSGTEAGMSAIRLARGYTGRNKIIKFEGCYHGHSDSLLVKAGSGMLTFGNPSSAGVPASVTEHTLVLEYNNPQQLEDAFAQWGDDIACVIVEAVAGNMNMVRGNPEFLRTMRELCTKHGAVLIVDEVMTGFRVAQGGAQAFYGIEPDLTMLGKVIGGGPMMGKALVNIEVPTAKGSSGILIMNRKEAKRGEAQTCIRCAKCVSACPMGLEPYLLGALSENGDFETMEKERIMDCIECGSCQFTCPANRPLLDYCRLGKGKVGAMIRARQAKK